jgi:hypothetical protein
VGGISGGLGVAAGVRLAEVFYFAALKCCFSTVVRRSVRAQIKSKGNEQECPFHTPLKSKSRRVQHLVAK